MSHSKKAFEQNSHATISEEKGKWNQLFLSFRTQWWFYNCHCIYACSLPFSVGKFYRKLCYLYPTEQHENENSRYAITFITDLQSLISNSETPSLLYFWPCCTACRIFVPWAAIKPVPSALEVWSPNHWTSWEVPWHIFLFFKENSGFQVPKHFWWRGTVYLQLYKQKRATEAWGCTLLPPADSSLEAQT